MTFRGVLVPVLTPFSADLKPDGEKFVALCRHLLAQGAAGLAIFGTTSEANSLGAPERIALLDMLLENGIPADKLLPGTGACSVTEATALTAHATARGCNGVLLLPPFYYKGVSDDGIYGFIDTVIQEVGSEYNKIYLYHIPPMAQVGFSVDLVGRLHRDHPDTVVGLKDSSGDWGNTSALLEAYPDMAIFPGSEVFLLDALRKGGAGCITATGNVNLPMIKALFDHWQDDDADERQATITAVRKVFQDAAPMVPLLKSYYAHVTGDADWAVVRPPLVGVDGAIAAEVAEALPALGFTFEPPA
jgi:4-hydroxy-tetrahydrodipicolinate synthase